MFTVAILTKNSSSTIQVALDSVKSASEIIIFDDGSTDSTLQIVKEYGVSVINLPKLTSFAEKRNWAMNKCQHEWIFFLDSDEQLTFPLSELIKLLHYGSMASFSFVRHDMLWGKPVKFGDNSAVVVRLIKKNTGTWVGDVHETWHPNTNIKVVDSELVISHYPVKNLYDYITKLNYYSSLRAKELKSTGKKVSIYEIVIWPIGKFVYLYLFKLGLLDGMPGLISALGMSFYTFLVRAKLWSIYQNLSV